MCWLIDWPRRVGHVLAVGLGFLATAQGRVGDGLHCSLGAGDARLFLLPKAGSQ